MVNKGNHLQRLIVDECANYFVHGPYEVRHWCVQRDMVCVAFGKPGKCNYFASHVLPVHPEVEPEYAAMAGIKSEEAVDMREVVCPVCGRVFLTANNRQQYCSEKCGEKAEREKARARSQAYRRRKNEAAA